MSYICALCEAEINPLCQTLFSFFAAEVDLPEAVELTQSWVGEKRGSLFGLLVCYRCMCQLRLRLRDWREEGIARRSLEKTPLGDSVEEAKNDLAEVLAKQEEIREQEGRALREIAVKQRQRFEDWRRGEQPETRQQKGELFFKAVKFWLDEAGLNEHGIHYQADRGERYSEGEFVFYVVHSGSNWESTEEQTGLQLCSTIAKSATIERTRERIRELDFADKIRDWLCKGYRSPLAASDMIRDGSALAVIERALKGDAE